MVQENTLEFVMSHYDANYCSSVLKKPMHFTSPGGTDVLSACSRSESRNPMLNCSVNRGSTCVNTSAGTFFCNRCLKWRKAPHSACSCCVSFTPQGFRIPSGIRSQSLQSLDTRTKALDWISWSRKNITESSLLQKDRLSKVVKKQTKMFCNKMLEARPDSSVFVSWLDHCSQKPTPDEKARLKQLSPTVWCRRKFLIPLFCTACLRAAETFAGMWCSRFDTALDSCFPSLKAFEIAPAFCQS